MFFSGKEQGIMDVITMTRGDSKMIRFKRRKCDGTIITTLPDMMYFTCKYSMESEAPVLFQKTLDNGIKYDEETNYYTFTIEPEDTESLPYVNLFYDIEIIIGTYKKTIASGKIMLEGEVTHPNDEDLGNYDEYLKKEEFELALKNKTDQELTSDKGTARIYNQNDGGGAMFISNSGSVGRLTVDDGDTSNIYVQMASHNQDKSKIVRLNANPDGIYYTKNKSDKKDFSEDDEIVTKKDLADRGIDIQSIPEAEIDSILEGVLSS